MPKHQGADCEERNGRTIHGASRNGGGGPICSARVVIALVDDRAIALIFPATRCVVLDRLGKLLGADEVHLAPCEEVDRIFGDRERDASRPWPDLRSVSVLMDASLLSARALEIESCGTVGPFRLALEDWLATANPVLGFFTEPDRTWS